MNNPPEYGAIILAAGSASRYRQADPDAAIKVVAVYKGEPMVRHVVRAAHKAGASPVIVVTGCEREAVRDALKDLQVSFAHNADYESGIASSLKAGLAALPQSALAAFILLGDMPLVSAELLHILVQALRDNPDADAIVPVHQGQRGNPVLLTRSLFDEAQKLKGDEGARRLLLKDSLNVVQVEADISAAVDIDTPDALKQLDDQGR